MDKSFNLSISTIERETGLTKETLRVWERRYGFPDPARDTLGERRYSRDQLLRLRLIVQLMGKGFRPGKIVPLEIAALEALLSQPPDVVLPPATDAMFPMDNLIDTIQEDNEKPGFVQDEIENKIHSGEVPDWLICGHPQRLFHELNIALSRLGLERFVLELASPLTRQVGQWWAEGKLGIVDEHLYSEQLGRVLRQAVAALPILGGRRQVLLATLPGEEHQLGLLMLESLLRLEGADCLTLARPTPSEDIINLCLKNNIGIVCLAFSANFPRQAARQAIHELRHDLPLNCELWAGGSGISRSPERSNRSEKGKAEAASSIKNIAICHGLEEAIERYRQWVKAEVSHVPR